MKNWKILSELIPGKNFIELLLVNRGITDIPAFLNPPSLDKVLTQLNSTMQESLVLADMLIKQAIAAGKPIIVHGDYDADGICATAILYKTLKFDLQYSNTHYFIPNRFEHGYGLSKNSVDAILANFPKDTKVLFITVDSGITSVAEVDYIKSWEHQVIITDHHQKPHQIPSADCIVWHDEIVGSSVAWVLSRFLGSTDPQSIALAGIATVTDLFPVVGINRTLIKEGLAVLNSNPPIGIKYLLEAAGRKEGEITTYDVGWVIGPRLNATGRLVNATQSLELLLTEDEKEAFAIATTLNDINSQRQDKTVEMYEKISENEGADLPKIIISSNEGYHEGIIGLVAARITQKHYRPAIVISLTETHGKGSVRSVPGVDIITFLRKFDDLFVSLGGHPMAAGFTILRENLPMLKERVLAASNTEIADELLVPVLAIDLKIPLTLVDLTFCEQVSNLKPFGIGNSEPVFMSENVGVSTINIVGKEQNHLSLRLFSGQNFYKAIFFGGAEFAKDINIGDRIDLAYTVKASEFNGKKYVDLFVKDLKKTQSQYNL